MNWGDLIQKLQSEVDLFLKHLPATLPAALVENIPHRNPSSYLNALAELEQNLRPQIDHACRDYAHSGRFQTKLSHEELFLLQPRFVEAIYTCTALDTPVQPKNNTKLFSLPPAEAQLVEWLLISVWHVRGQLNWMLQEEATARRAAFLGPPPNDA